MAVRSSHWVERVDGQTTRRPDGREDHGARLRVIDRAALQVATVGHAHDDRRTERVARTPANGRSFIAEL